MWLDRKIKYDSPISRCLLHRKTELKTAREGSSTTNLDTGIHESIAKPLTRGVLRAKVCTENISYEMFLN